MSKNSNDVETVGLSAIFAVVAMDKLDEAAATFLASLDEDNVDGAMLVRSGIRADKKCSDMATEKRDKELKAVMYREIIRRALIEIDRIIAFHQQKLEELLEQLDHANQVIQKLNEQYKILDAELKRFQEQGCFDLDEDGRLKNSKAEVVVVAWEAKTGQVIDRSDYETMLTVLYLIDQDRIATRENIQVYTNLYDFHKQKLDEAQEVKTALENGDESALMKLQEFQTLDSVSQISQYDTIKAENESTKQLEPPVDTFDDNFSFGFEPIENKSTSITKKERNLPPVPLR